MDEFLVSGETIVRNLEYGQRRAAEFGGAMPVGYLPDMFGHVAQMPQILRQAGIDTAVVWSGVPAAIDSHSFEWESPDGSSVRAEYLPYGYGNGAYLLDVPGQLGRGLDAVRESHREFFGDEPILAMFGTDHMEPLPQLTDLLEESGAAAQVSTLPDYLATVDGRPNGRRWRGELRSSARANILMGTLSARLDLKAAMARAERALTRYGEPFQALYGTAWPERLLDLAWRRLIENSAHDSICGCSVDEVSTQVLVRCYEAEQIAMGLAEDAAREAAAEAPMGSVVAFNPSPTARWDNVELSLGVPARWKDIALELPDGARVAAQRITRNEPLLYEERVAELRRPRVAPPTAPRSRALRTAAQPDDHRGPDGHVRGRRGGRPDLARPRRAEERARGGDERRGRRVGRPDRRPSPLDRRRQGAGAAARGGRRCSPSRAPAPSRTRAGRPDGLDNGLLSVAVAADGTLSLGGAEGVGRLVDGGDEGDSYNYAPPAEDHLVEEPDDVRVSVIAEGPVRGVVSIVRSYRWSPAQVPVEVETTVELRAGERFCRVRVSFENPLSDHRLRFHVPLPREAGSPPRRASSPSSSAALEAEEGFGEVALPTFPAYGFVDAGGMAALLEHPMEYEVVGGRELALTILRSTGLISRSAHAYRESPAGPEIAIPAAQCRGPWSIGFALYPHDGAWHEAGVLAELERYLHPFLCRAGGGARRPDQRDRPGATRRGGRPLRPAAARPAAGGTGCVRASGAGAGRARRGRAGSPALGDPDDRARPVAGTRRGRRSRRSRRPRPSRPARTSPRRGRRAWTDVRSPRPARSRSRRRTRCARAARGARRAGRPQNRSRDPRRNAVAGREHPGLPPGARAGEAVDPEDGRQVGKRSEVRSQGRDSLL